MSDEKELNRVMMTVTVIWIVMLASLAAYLVVGLLAAPQVTAVMSGESIAVLRKALYAIGLVTLLAVGYVRRLIWTGGSRPGGMEPALSPALPQKYAAAVIASLAMCESVGIYGLVLYLLGKSATDLFLLLGISAVAMIHYRPKKEELAG